jgi:hypothetical protein
MKKIIIVIIVFIGTIFVTNSQTFSNKKDFQEYFEKNSSTIDPIEGFYLVYPTQIIEGKAEINDTYQCAIIKKNGVLQECHINRNGQYSPTAYSLTFNKNYADYKASLENIQCNVTRQSEYFQIKNGRFSFTINLTHILDCIQKYNYTCYMKYVYAKL